jgi:hypothetical protein
MTYDVFRFGIMVKGIVEEDPIARFSGGDPDLGVSGLSFRGS